MKAWLKKNCCSEITPAWLLKMALSLVLPALIMVFRPLGMNFAQSATTAGVLLVIIWWTTNLVKKVPASLFLLLWFCLFSGAPAKTIFTFPTGETFIMLVITYLFSQAISNCGLIDRVLLPLLLRFVRTPVSCILAVIASFCLTMYVIPQPLARLVLVSVVFDSFFKRTTVPTAARQVLMYAVFVFYAVVNIACKDADLIMNYVAVNSSGAEITNGMWTRAMAVPMVGYAAVVMLVMLFLFRRELSGVSIRVAPDVEPAPSGFKPEELPPVIVILATVLLWMTSGLWGKNIVLFGYITANTIVTIVSTLILFAMKTIGKKDFSAIDVVTLIFLSAAFSIGGVMKACGAADVVFGQFRGIFPESFSVRYLMLIILVGMLLHMVLGSNTTTLSVIVPGLVLLCGNVISPEVVVYASIISVSFHAILPFHSVALMVGASNGYYPSSYVTRLGIPITPFVFLAGALIYLPWWKLIGLL